jgi:hypothetical protein
MATARIEFIRALIGGDCFVKIFAALAIDLARGESGAIEERACGRRRRSSNTTPPDNDLLAACQRQIEICGGRRSEDSL